LELKVPPGKARGEIRDNILNSQGGTWGLKGIKSPVDGELQGGTWGSRVE